MSSIQMRKLITILEQAAPAKPAPAMGQLARLVSKPDGFDYGIEHMHNQQVKFQNTFANMPVGTKFTLFAGSSSNPVVEIKGTYAGVDPKNDQQLMIKLPSGEVQKWDFDDHAVHAPLSDDAPMFTTLDMATVYSALESAEGVYEDLAYDNDLKREVRDIAKQLGIKAKLAVLVMQVMQEADCDAAQALSMINKY